MISCLVSNNKLGPRQPFTPDILLNNLIRFCLTKSDKWMQVEKPTCERLLSVLYYLCHYFYYNFIIENFGVNMLIGIVFDCRRWVLKSLKGHLYSRNLCTLCISLLEYEKLLKWTKACRYFDKSQLSSTSMQLFSILHPSFSLHFFLHTHINIPLTEISIGFFLILSISN